MVNSYEVTVIIDDEYMTLDVLDVTSKEEAISSIMRSDTLRNYRLKDRVDIVSVRKIEEEK